LLALQGVEADLELPAIDEILDQEALPSRQRVAASAPTPEDASTLSQAQEDDILRRLRALGYE
jgi:hypothetical protein